VGVGDNHIQGQGQGRALLYVIGSTSPSTHDGGGDVFLYAKHGGIGVAATAAAAADSLPCSPRSPTNGNTFSNGNSGRHASMHGGKKPFLRKESLDALSLLANFAGLEREGGVD
jgi:hypothetical protein